MRGRGGQRGRGRRGQGYLAVSVVSVHRRQLQLQAGHLGEQLQLLGLEGRAVQQLLRSFSSTNQKQSLKFGRLHEHQSDERFLEAAPTCCSSPSVVSTFCL